MLDIDYASINTAVRIRENDLLTKETFEGLLKAKDFSQAQQLLKSTAYRDVPEDFEPLLVAELAKTTDFVTEQVAGAPVAQIFSLIYTYHNLKVLLKNHLAGLDLEHLLVHMGAFDLDELRHLVKTEQSETLPELLVQAVQDTCQEYREYGRLESVDVLLDRRYFKHLVAVARELADPAILNMVQAWVDLYNLNCIFRLRDKKLSRAFLMSVLSNEGQLKHTELIALALANRYDDLLALLNETDYASALTGMIDQEGDLNLSLELARDRVSHVYLDDARFEAFGFLPLLAYNYYKEMEVKNLRLILTGKMNDFDQSMLRERMRPIYDL
ncbi:V-type ATPase subunit [Streptococcus porci]|uniref:V-type ATPase subunit n=1 Tax=Streptococcus porci TaxID=502567 RepID=UPI0004135587|nr:V-type ATPase subunit [Streptococcus porci]